MNAIAKTNADEVQAEWFDKVYESNSDLWLAVDAMLQLMMKAGLPMPSERLKQFSLEDPETIGVYVMDLADAGIGLADIMADGHAVRRMLRFFPSSAELVQAMLSCRERREPSHVILDPVYICRDGVRLTRRSIAEARGWDYWETQYECEVANGLRQPMKELPMGGPKALEARLTDLAGAFTTITGLLPEGFPAREKLAAAGITTMFKLRTAKQLPVDLDQAELDQVAAAIEADRVLHEGGMTAEKRREVMAELEENGRRHRERVQLRQQAKTG